MIFNKQLFKHDPANGTFGDCYRTCIACLLNLKPHQVPNFGEHYDDLVKFEGAAREWLCANGYKSVQLPLNPNYSLTDVLTCMQVWNPDVYYFITGMAARGFNHVVIARNDQVIHDPHPSGDGLTGPAEEGGQVSAWWIEVLLPASLHYKEISA